MFNGLPACVLIILLFLTVPSFSQKTDTWYADTDKETGLTGFRDETGNLKLPHRYYTSVRQFNNIIGVLEDRGERMEGYYLLKNGRIVGHDSLFIYDNTPDCEKEGVIRFTDRKTDKTGCFGINGNIVIPADYDYLSQFNNGLAVALKGAIKVCSEKRYNPDDPCEHWMFSGGQTMLIDLENKVLVRDFKDTFLLDWNSVQIATDAGDTNFRENFRGVNGLYYSFVNHEKYFRNIFLPDLINNLTAENLIANCYPRIVYWDEQDGWIFSDRNHLINNNLKIIRARLDLLKSINSNYFFSTGGLNKFIFEDPEFLKYFDGCGEPLIYQYPLITVVQNYSIKNKELQDMFQFLKTDEGYKLTGIVIDGVKLK